MGIVGVWGTESSEGSFVHGVVLIPAETPAGVVDCVLSVWPLQVTSWLPHSMVAGF
jgi:hypothetical protein